MSQPDTDNQLTPEQEQQEAIRVWFQHVQQVLVQEFEEYKIEGQVAIHPKFGPIFAYTLEKDGNAYSCGFLLNELVRNFQKNDDPGLWLSSFYVDLIREPESKPLPQPPQSEEEAKEIFDKIIVPHCAQSIRSEFEGEPIYVDLELNPEHGPVLEAGFPNIKDGNNTCAMPLDYLMAQYLLNRDPADPIISAMYRLKEEHEAAGTAGDGQASE